eukprot:COSAG05_NODE_866_length_6876_cov_11.223255_7_plen_276_part_00
MLQTGTGPASGFDPTLGPPNVTLDESITEFSMWAILASPLLFTTPIMNCTAASSSTVAAAATDSTVAAVAVAVPSPSPVCTCTKQLSTKAECIEGKSFGCLPNGSMWAVGCRGMFTCDGVAGVKCDVNMPDPPRNHTCKCRASPSPSPSPSPPHHHPSSPPMTPKHCKAYLNEVQQTVLLNKELIAVNQDVTPQGFPTVAGDSSVWARNLSGSSFPPSRPFQTLPDLAFQLALHSACMMSSQSSRPAMHDAYEGYTLTWTLYRALRELGLVVLCC